MLGGGSTTLTTVPSSSSSHASDNTTSPTSRPGRLRGLSYLRNYTTHLHTSRNPAAPLTRALTSPAGRPSSSSGSAPVSPTDQDVASSPRRSNTTRGTTSGWVPSVGGQSGISSPPSTSPILPVSGSAQSATAMTRNRAGTYSEQGQTGNNGHVNPGVSRSLSADILSNGSDATAGKKANMPTIRLIPHHETRSSRPSLTFPIINRTLPTEDAIIRVGRYSERDNQAAQQDTDSTLVPVGFKSKVVSRRHCEFWCQNNQWFIKDVKSSSGTFLNHVRLSSAGTESKPYPLNDGDIVQLGIDFKGGEEVIFRCVKIRVECNRSWQKGLNQFNTTAHKRLRDLAATTKDSDSTSIKSDECSICLNPVAPYQALFVAPCSHVWHYKCIRTLIYPDWPSFQCPNCRAYADLEADVDPQELDADADEDSDAALTEALRISKEEHSNGNAAGQLAQSTTHQTLAGGDQLSGDDDDDDREEAERTQADATAGAADPTHPPKTPPKEILSARSATPTSTAPFALVADVIGGGGSGGSGNVVPANEGPSTPRNDAGPFLLDSAAGSGHGGGSGGSKRSLPRRPVGADGGEGRSQG